MGFAAAGLVEGGLRILQLTEDDQIWSVLVTRRNGQLRAFLNACPHQYLPLDFAGPNILSADGATLMCSMHGAMFAIEDGHCVTGPAMPCALTAVDVLEKDGMVRLGAIRW
ncbi:hypothetical protein VW29_14975 [Devosia limi DSM 17137]|uniref:Rieske domain-containing protein n=1 Tax=Devosia limi DSM 17137 TaxID=1121477 RepID=A0A0F5LKH9_9HYPH|nr:hypothetical protein VW29_14975 [Devosia limi DSM 17137]